MHEARAATRTAGSPRARAPPRALAARCSSRSASAATAERPAPAPSTASARATVAASSGSRASRSRTAREAARGPTSATRSTWVRCRAHVLGLERLEQLGRAAAGCRPSRCDRRPRRRRRAARRSRSRTRSETAGGAERPRTHRDGQRVARDLAQERRLPLEPGRSQATDHQDGQSLQPAPEVARNRSDGAIAPVQVVDGEQQRPVLAQVQRQPVETVQGRERRIGRRLAGRQRPAGLEDRARWCRRPGQRRRVACRQLRLEELADDTEREVVLELSAPRGQHAEAPCGRLPSRLGDEPGLADPGRALDDDQTGGSPCGLADERPSDASSRSRSSIRPPCAAAGDAAASLTPDLPRWPSTAAA